MGWARIDWFNLGLHVQGLRIVYSSVPSQKIAPWETLTEA